MNNFLPTIKDVIAKYKLQLAKEKTKDIHELLCKYIETLIFNDGYKQREQADDDTEGGADEQRREDDPPRPRGARERLH